MFDYSMNGNEPLSVNSLYVWETTTLTNPFTTCLSTQILNTATDTCVNYVEGTGTTFIDQSFDFVFENSTYFYMGS